MGVVRQQGAALDRHASPQPTADQDCVLFNLAKISFNHI